VTILSADWVLPVSGPPIRDGAVAIEDGRITAVGAATELGEGTRYGNAVILPGFVNAHTHLEYAVYAGFGDGEPFAAWLATHMERKAGLEPEDMADIARLGAAECLASGVTTVGDASYAGASAAACDQLGLRAIVYLEVFLGDPEAAMSRFDGLRARASSALSDRVRLGVSPHTPYTTSAEVYEACLGLGLPVMTHFAESEAESLWLTRGEGPFAGPKPPPLPPVGTTGIRYLADRGLLGPIMVAAHCVWVDEEEIELLARHDVAVAHCPRSNAVLGCGVAPLTDLRAAGLRVGIGTDSPASAPSLDMFEEVRSAVYAARARERRADALTAADALELATLGGARALGLDAEIGSLEPGKRADLTVVSFEGSPFLPWEDPVSAVVLGGSPARVLTTLVGGKVRYERGAFEWLELQQKGHHARSRLLSRSRPAASGRPTGR
jgi:cytosine/adenosine deaminase-related metal-dependent hydrolase